jgi:hypothetical protein
MFKLPGRLTNCGAKAEPPLLDAAWIASIVACRVLADRTTPPLTVWTVAVNA